MTTTEVAGHNYDIGELSAVQQLHVARRIMLAFAKELPRFIGLMKRWKSTGGKLTDDDDLLDVLEPFAEALGRIPDDDFETIVKICGGCIRRETSAGTWTRITTPNDTTLMFKDIKAGALMILIWKVVEANLADFFPGLPQLSDVPDKTAQP